jgi:hypothetical protein
MQRVVIIHHLLLRLHRQAAVTRRLQAAVMRNRLHLQTVDTSKHHQYHQQHLIRTCHREVQTRTCSHHKPPPIRHNNLFLHTPRLRTLATYNHHRHRPYNRQTIHCLTC